MKCWTLKGWKKNKMLKLSCNVNYPLTKIIAWWLRASASSTVWTGKVLWTSQYVRSQ